MVSPSDWLQPLNKTKEVPMTCCEPISGTIGSATCAVDSKNLYDKGCLDLFGAYIKAHALTLGASAMVLAFIQLVGIVFACFLTKQIRERQWLDG